MHKHNATVSSQNNQVSIPLIRDQSLHFKTEAFISSGYVNNNGCEWVNYDIQSFIFILWYKGFNYSKRCLLDCFNRELTVVLYLCIDARLSGDVTGVLQKKLYT